MLEPGDASGYGRHLSQGAIDAAPFGVDDPLSDQPSGKAMLQPFAKFNAPFRPILQRLGAARQQAAAVLAGRLNNHHRFLDSRQCERRRLSTPTPQIPASQRA